MKFNPKNKNWIKSAKIGLNLTKIDQKMQLLKVIERN